MDTDGNEEHTAANGDGPVNALDNALRKALSKLFPITNQIRLTDYKVRVLDERSATAASVRVLIRSTDGKRSWTTIGVSENVIEASLVALVDSIEYAIYKNTGRET
jgi:2-isopropylmalate synthase